MNIGPIALLGLGEVGTIFADDLARAGHGPLGAFDVQFADPASGPSRALRARPHVAAFASAAAAVERAGLVISAVTAAQDAAAARAALPGLARGAWYLDLNSVAPQTRVAVARLIDGAGGRYVEAAVMSPVPPRGLAVPILLGGPHAAGFAPLAAALGFSGARPFAAEVGRASAAKMCRSVVVKGLEALVGEALLAARHYGVEDEVLASLGDLLPHPDWPGKARYLISRSLEHGARRAEEMTEVAATVAATGLEPDMSVAAGKRQRWAAQFGAARDFGLPAMLDAIRARLDKP